MESTPRDGERSRFGAGGPLNVPSQHRGLPDLTPVLNRDVAHGEGAWLEAAGGGPAVLELLDGSM